MWFLLVSPGRSLLLVTPGHFWLLLVTPGTGLICPLGGARLRQKVRIGQEGARRGGGVTGPVSAGSVHKKSDESQDERGDVDNDGQTNSWRDLMCVCVCVCVCVWVCTCLHACERVCICVCTCLYAFACKFLYACVCVRACMRVCVCV